MPRPQFTLRALLVLMLTVACFLGGVRFERERRRRADARIVQRRIVSEGQTLYAELLRADGHTSRITLGRVRK